MTEPRAPYRTESPLVSANGAAANAGQALTCSRRAELWRALCSHLIGLATVFWWIAFKEPPPK